MDEMTISSEFTRKLVSKILEREIRKRTGIEVNIDLKPFNLKVSEEGGKAHIELDASMKKEELAKLAKFVK